LMRRGPGRTNGRRPRSSSAAGPGLQSRLGEAGFPR
jgi:hypothetical protein